MDLENLINSRDIPDYPHIFLRLSLIDSLSAVLASSESLALVTRSESNLQLHTSTYDFLSNCGCVSSILFFWILTIQSVNESAHIFVEHAHCIYEVDRNDLFVGATSPSTYFVCYVKTDFIPWYLRSQHLFYCDSYSLLWIQAIERLVYNSSSPYSC